MKRLFCILLAVSLFAALPAVAQQEQPQQQPQAAQERPVKEAYEYTSSTSRDPFLSIIEASKRRNELERERKKKKGLAPLEDYDLSQFNLIAVVWDGKQYLAMIGLPDGKYYTLKVNMVVGIHAGKVMDISQNSVLIREYLPDYKGDLKPQDTVLRLRKEEGE